MAEWTIDIGYAPKIGKMKLHNKLQILDIFLKYCEHVPSTHEKRLPCLLVGWLQSEFNDTVVHRRLLAARWPLVSIGGVSNLSTVLSYAGDVTTSGFVGCLRDVTLGGRNMLVSDDVSGVSKSANLSRDSCALRPVAGRCSDHPCANGGRCVDEWTNYRCQCPVGFTGQSCMKGMLTYKKITCLCRGLLGQLVS